MKLTQSYYRTLTLHFIVLLEKIPFNGKKKMCLIPQQLFAKTLCFFYTGLKTVLENLLVHQELALHGARMVCNLRNIQHLFYIPIMILQKSMNGKVVVKTQESWKMKMELIT